MCCIVFMLIVVIYNSHNVKFRTFTSKGTHYYEGKLNMSFCTIAEIIQEIAKPLAIKIMVWNKLDSGP